MYVKNVEVSISVFQTFRSSVTVLYFPDPYKYHLITNISNGTSNEEHDTKYSLLYNKNDVTDCTIQDMRELVLKSEEEMFQLSCTEPYDVYLVREAVRVLLPRNKHYSPNNNEKVLLEVSYE